MRLLSIIAILFVLQTEICCQETESKNTFNTPDNSIAFTYNVLPTEQPGQSDFIVSGDTVSLTLFYVDISCSDYTYVFKRDGKSLIVQRITKESDRCDKEAEQLYGFDGKMVNVPSGKYLFELESIIGETKSTIFREVLKVK